jgi:hypothetical protein
MAEFGGPLPSSAVATTSQARGLFRGTSATGVYADTISRFTGGLAVTNGGSLNATVAAGQASVAGLYYENDASKALTLSAADPTDARIDVIVVRLNPASTGTLALAVLEGTPDPSPVAVAVTVAEDGIYELAIAEVVVPAGSAVLGTITDVRVFTTRGNTFTALDDTPSTLTGQGGKTLKVDSGGTAVEFVATPDLTVISGFSQVAASLTTNTQLKRASVSGSSAQSTTISVALDRPGSIVGISVSSSDVRTAGTMTFEVYKNGSATGLTCVINASDTQYAFGVQAVGLDTFVAGDRVDVRGTNASYTIGSTYFEACVTVAFDS